MLAKFSGLNPKGPFLSLEKEKENFCVVLTYEVSCRSCATTAKKCTKSVMYVQSCLFAQSEPTVPLLFAVTVAKPPNCYDPEILPP